jgi:hypothetical protein
VGIEVERVKKSINTKKKRFVRVVVVEVVVV